VLCYFRCSKSQVKERPKTFIDTLNMWFNVIFDNSLSYKNSATLPVSVVSCEHSFSWLCKLNMYLYNNTGDEWLSEMVLLNVYRVMKMTFKEVMVEMAIVPRLMDFIL